MASEKLEEKEMGEMKCVKMLRKMFAYLLS